MNEPPANDVACRIIVAHHNHLKMMMIINDSNDINDNNVKYFIIY